MSEKEPSLGYRKLMVAKIFAAETPVLEMGRILKLQSNRWNRDVTISSAHTRHYMYLFPFKAEFELLI